MFFKERLRALFSESPLAGRVAPRPPQGGARSPVPRTSAPIVRSSRGLDHFFQALSTSAGFNILDLGESSQENISAITDLGHRISSENFLYSLDEFLQANPPGSLAEASLSRRFFEHVLRFPPGHFQGALAWNIIEYIPAPMLGMFMDRLLEILSPGAVVFSLFHADFGLHSPDCYSFRIIDGKTLRLVPRGSRPVVQQFNNRGLERLFGRFRSVKFFLTRDAFRELLVTR
jgi:hypothetical protein